MLENHAQSRNEIFSFENEEGEFGEFICNLMVTSKAGPKPLGNVLGKLLQHENFTAWSLYNSLRGENSFNRSFLKEDLEEQKHVKEQQLFMSAKRKNCQESWGTNNIVRFLRKTLWSRQPAQNQQLPGDTCDLEKLLTVDKAQGEKKNQRKLV